MQGTNASARKVSLKILQMVFWGAFAAVAIASIISSQSTGYGYSVETSLTTYSSVLQGVGALMGALIIGLLLRKQQLESQMRSIEDKAIGDLTNRMGWSVAKWSDELEKRIEEELSGGYASAQTYNQASSAPSTYSPPVQVTQTAEAEKSSDEYLEKELDELLDAIMVEDESQLQVQQQVAYQPPMQQVASQVAVEARDVVAAVQEHRQLVRQKKELISAMASPAAMFGVLLSVCAWALPASEAFLQTNAFLNTALIFLTTYGSVIAVLFAASSALKLARN